MTNCAGIDATSKAIGLRYLEECKNRREEFINKTLLDLSDKVKKTDLTKIGKQWFFHSYTLRLGTLSQRLKTSAEIALERQN
jgi:hypothetical protein